MAGTITGLAWDRTRKTHWRLVIDWTSDAAGEVVVFLPNPRGDSYWIHGRIVNIETIPGRSGDRSTNTPTADYAVIIGDQFYSTRAAAYLLSDSVAEDHPQATPVYMFGVMLFVISGAGINKEGRTILIFDRCDSMERDE